GWTSLLRGFDHVPLLNRAEADRGDRLPGEFSQEIGGAFTQRFCDATVNLKPVGDRRSPPRLKATLPSPGSYGWEVSGECPCPGRYPLGHHVTTRYLGSRGLDTLGGHRSRRNGS